MIERVVTFGAENCLTGIVSEPPVARSASPAVLLVTAGIIHHVGPYRLYVDLARKLAPAGFLTLRFDVSGVGDSQPRPDHLTDAEAPLADIREAMDFLQGRYGTSEFVLLGLCSGAYQAHEVAVRDTRVVGTVQLDGYGYRTVGYYLHQLVRKYLSPRRWAKFLLRKKKERSAGNWNPRPEDPRLEIYGEAFPPRPKVKMEIHGLAARGVRMLFIYSGGVPEYFNHRGQFVAMFGRLPAASVTMEYFESADHTYAWSPDREMLVARIADWLNEGFPTVMSPSVTAAAAVATGPG
jgi:dienelactone hydrolase